MLPNFARIRHLSITLVGDIEPPLEFSAKRAEASAKVQEYYQKGLKYFEGNNFELAEKEFV